MTVKSVYFEIAGCEWYIDEDNGEVIIKNIDASGEVIMDKDSLPIFVEALNKYLKLLDKEL